MARLYKTRKNIDRIVEDSEKNKFRISDVQRGFVWLSHSRGSIQIPTSELKFYREKRRR